MKYRDFLEKHCLSFCIKNHKMDQAMNLIKEMNESYVILYQIEESIGLPNTFDIHIHCPTTNFANAYFQIGRVFERNNILTVI